MIQHVKQWHFNIFHIPTNVQVDALLLLVVVSIRVVVVGVVVALLLFYGLDCVGGKIR